LICNIALKSLGSPGLFYVRILMGVNPRHEAIQRITLAETRSDIFNPRAFLGEE